MGVEWEPWGHKEERKGKRGNSQALLLALPFQLWEEWSGIEPSLAARGTPKRGQIMEEWEEGRGWKAWKQKGNKGESGKKIEGEKALLESGEEIHQAARLKASIIFQSIVITIQFAK